MTPRAAATLFGALAGLGCASVSATPDSGIDPIEAAADSGDLDASMYDAEIAIDATLETPQPDPACDVNGCLRAASFYGDYSIGELTPYLEAGVAIDNGYSVWSIRFWTDGREAIAAVTVPYGIPTPAEGYHIVGNNHGTTGIDDPCALTGTVYGTALAGLFGARGLIGVAHDYPGLGTEGLHPYLVADVEGKSALDALRATLSLARWQEIPISDRFAMVGLSQGGHATLAAAALHSEYATELDIRAFSATAPGTVWEEHFRSGISIDGAHVPLHAMLVHAWATHYDYDGPPLWASTIADSIDARLRSECAITLPASLGSERSAIFHPDFLAAYSSGNWGAYDVFREWFALNRIGPFTQTAPFKIYQGTLDTMVLPWMTEAVVNALRAGGVDVEYEIVPGGTHLNVAWGYVASNELRTTESIAWLRDQLDRDE